MGSFGGYGKRALTVAAALGALAVMLVPMAGAQAAAAPTCTIADQTVLENDGATQLYTWNLECTNPTGVEETATFQTVAATAKASSDYVALGATLTVPPGLSTRPIPLDVIGGDVPEPTESYAIRFEDPEGVVQFRDADGAEKTIAVITIEDDDGFTVTSVSRSAQEGDVGSSVAEVEVTLNEPVDRPFEVLFYTGDVGATAGSDYEAVNVRLSFAPGEVSKLVPITILGDEEDEPDEAVFLGLGIEGIATLQSGGLTIVDDDGGGAGTCLLLSEDSIDQSGPASTPSRRGFAGPGVRITMTNCGDSAVEVDVRGTSATGAGATWQLTDASSGGALDSTCELGPNLFRGVVTLWLPGGGGIGPSLTTQGARLMNPDETPATFAPAVEREITPQIELPCESSAGIGQPMTLDITLTAIAP